MRESFSLAWVSLLWHTHCFRVYVRTDASDGWGMCLRVSCCLSAEMGAWRGCQHWAGAQERYLSELPAFLQCRVWT